MINEHEMQIRVRYSETDAMGRVHHANYLNYFEMGRTEQLRALGQTYREFEESKLYLVVTKISVQYHRGAKYDDLLRLRTRTMKVTMVRIDHEYELFQEDQLVAKAASTLACIDGQGRVQRIPEWLLVRPSEEG